MPITDQATSQTDASADTDETDVLDPSDTLEGPFELEFDTEEALVHKILVVDDELHILKAVQRLFIDSDCELLTAENGEEALQILRTEQIAVIVSDQRMPGMSGTKLLQLTREHTPKTVRIMLTGNNDVSTALKAINDGEVFRFITKPWEHDNFLRIIDLALEQHELLNSKERYEKHIEAQNDELHALNSELREFNVTLEERVEDRTKEVQAQKQEVARLYQELQHSFDGMIKALLCIMELGEIHVVEHCQRTAERVRNFADHLGLHTDLIRELERAALLHWIGLINASPTLFRKPLDEFDAVEEATWEFHPLLGQQAIRHVPALNGAGRIILHYLKRYDDPNFKIGKPSADEGDKPLTKSFVTACQTLALCSTFEQVRTAARRSPSTEAEWSQQVEKGLRVLADESGGRFDPELVRQFRELMGEEVVSSRSKEVVVSFGDMEPGMVLARPLETAQGIPVAPRDMIITDELIERLERFRVSNGLNEIYIWA